MVRVGMSKAAVIRVERLEDRCVLAPWPVPVAGISGIAATYGQFDNRGNGQIHFHEGIDIVVGVGTEVRAIEGGTVVGLDSTLGYDNHISIATTANNGWNYLHLTPLASLTTAYVVAKALGSSITVTANELIGHVVAYPGTENPTHLHIDAAGSKEPADPAWLRPVDDPLARLDPLGDTTAPTMGDIHFLRGEDDNNIPHNLSGGGDTKPPSTYKIMQTEARREDHGYFKAVDFTRAWIVGHYAPATTSAGAAVSGTSNIDIVANATDTIKGADLVGVRSIEFKAAGLFVGRTIGTVRLFNFAGQFVSDPNRPAVTQTYDALRISDLTRVAYENDYTSPSNAQKPDTFHLVTNTDAQNTVVELADRKRYWRSKVVLGSAWNDIGSAEAPNNAQGAYPDDYYTITVTARDAAGNAKSKAELVLLDNWVQVLNPVRVASQPGDPAGTTRVRFTGSNWTADATAKVSLVNGLTIAEGATVSQHGPVVAVVSTDANGDVIPQEAVVTIPADGNPYEFLGDYHHGDGVYQPRLDALAPLQTMDQRPMSASVDSPFALLPAAPGVPPRPPARPPAAAPPGRPLDPAPLAARGTAAPAPVGRPDALILPAADPGRPDAVAADPLADW